MAEFVTRAENGRRKIILIFCILISAVSLIVGALALKEAGDLHNGEENPNSVVRLQGKLKTFQDEYRDLRSNVLKFSEPIGWSSLPGTTEERLPVGLVSVDMGTQYGVYDAQMKEFLDFWAKELKNDYGVTNLVSWEGSGEIGNKLTLTKLYEILEERLKYYDSAIKQLEGDTTILRQKEEASVEEMYVEDDKTKNGIVGSGGLLADYKNNLADQVNKRSSYATELQNLELTTKQAQDDLTATKQAHNRVRTALEGRKGELMLRINWIKHRQEEAEERKDPDGAILSVNSERQVAWIDLAHKDRLFKGTEFYVYSLRKGGEKRDKGIVRVIEVGQDRSKVAIVKLMTEDDLQPEDRIYNKYFERGVPRQIAFAGRFTGKLSNIEAAREVRGFGDQYQERVDQTTNYVIVGEGYETDPNFEAALDWGVKLILEKYFYDYLGVPVD